MGFPAESTKKKNMYRLIDYAVVTHPYPRDSLDYVQLSVIIP